MKKICPMTVLLFLCVLLAGCGGQKDNGESAWRGVQAGMEDLSAITERTEYYDIVVESEAIFQWEQRKEESPLAMSKAAFICMQFYRGEPVQLWREPNLGSYGELLSWDICFYRPDGSREAILQGTGSPYNGCGYLDQEGNFYWWENSTVRTYSDGKTEKTGTSLKKYAPSGELLFDRQYDYGYDIEDLCEKADGRIYLIVGNREQGYRRLAELEPATGLVTEQASVQMVTGDMDSQRLGVWGEKLVSFKLQTLLGSEVVVIDGDDGSEACLLSFTGTSYLMPVHYEMHDFRVLDDESVEILWAFSDGSKSLQERLRMTKVEKTPIVLRGVNIEGWLAGQINGFNRQSEKYHVIVEDCGRGNDREDFARLTSIQIASGKGPDILYGSLMEDYITGMIEKGALEDLRPYMERSGISEEDYFPYTFSIWRDEDRICGVSPASPSLEGYCMDSSVLGGTQEPDIEALVNALLSRREDAVFLKGYDSMKLLGLLLEGSDTVWGMVDWESGSCDFSGELFTKILDVAKRYGDSAGKGKLSCLAEEWDVGKVYSFEDRAEREKNDKVICGVLFDDGCHPAVMSCSALAVNANSPNKEGAWEFIAFLLGDEAQSAVSGVPAARRTFDAWVRGQKEEFEDGKEIKMLLGESLADGSTVITGMIVYTEADITEEIIEEYIRMLEDARSCPPRTVPVLALIKEEASDYFNGSKSAAEAAGLVTNRVQTYLDERQ